MRSWGGGEEGRGKAWILPVWKLVQILPAAEIMRVFAWPCIPAVKAFSRQFSSKMVTFSLCSIPFPKT